MKSKYYLIVIALLFSCQRVNHIKPIKLIYLVGQDICFDSLDKPHLSIRKYLEYSSQKSYLSIAKGNRYYDSIAPIFGLNKFFKIQLSNQTVTIVNDYFSKCQHDSSYFSNKQDPWYFYIISENNNGTINVISFGRYDYVPSQIYCLKNHFDSIINSNQLIEENRFQIDSAVFKLEKKLFIKHPPPPKPNNLSSFKPNELR